MKDEVAIRLLQTAYCKLFDSRDAQAYGELYTEDAVVLAPWGQEIRGREKLRRAVRNTPAGGWHEALESEIKVFGDAAEGICRFRAQDLDGTIDSGCYEDRYVRTAEGWRISYRRVIVESRDICRPERPVGGVDS